MKTSDFSYFSGPKPRVLAHRGLAQHLGIAENTIEAFQEALNHGATHLESDTHATRDGHAVLVHDPDLRRLAGEDALVNELTLEEVQRIELIGGGRIPTLEGALAQLPDAKFNLDIKAKTAIEPTIRAIEQRRAHHRVLVSSFSNPVRLSALRGTSAPIATSGSMQTVIAAWLSHRLAFGIGMNLVLKNVQALQIPTGAGRIRFATESFIRRVQASDTEVHFWTINDPEEMKSLLAMGADGIVSDRVDLFAG